ncbi:MAG: dihydrolipoyl dehydrogenase [Candidatus Omnitrophica bacterium]|nr:dihydrolipoyl dehydrogenase [Candidatus Omnitrophota bacterium]
MYDLVVIGAGPGGTRAARVASQAGLKVLLVEKEHVGGVCLNSGCIPTKTLVHGASIVESIREGGEYGVNVSLQSVDIGQLFAKKTAIVEQLRKGSELSVKKAPYDFIEGTASFVSSSEIAVNGTNYRFKHAIIATGSRPKDIPGIVCDGTYICNSKQMLVSSNVPKKIVIIGGGYIGCEWASILSSLGCEVTIIEMTDALLPFVSASLAKRLEGIFKKKGIQMYLTAKVKTVRNNADTVIVTTDEGTSIEAGRVLVCVGRMANLDTCALDRAGVVCEEGFVKTDEYLRTNIETIYAIGDVVNAPQLAHTAFHEGEVAVKNILAPCTVSPRYDAIPNCIFTDPEIAFVGALGRTPSVKEVRVPFGSNGKAHCESAIEGVFVLYVETATGLIKGAEMMGKHATELISYVALAMELKLSVHRLAEITFPHPTLSEIISDAFKTATL